jgi:hypothetical protein
MVEQRTISCENVFYGKVTAHSHKSGKNPFEMIVFRTFTMIPDNTQFCEFDLRWRKAQTLVARLPRKGGEVLDLLMAG